MSRRRYRRYRPIDHITIKELENCRISYITYHIKNEQIYNIAYTYTYMQRVLIYN